MAVKGKQTKLRHLRTVRSDMVRLLKEATETEAEAHRLQDDATRKRKIAEGLRLYLEDAAGPKPSPSSVKVAPPATPPRPTHKGWVRERLAVVIDSVLNAAGSSPLDANEILRLVEAKVGSGIYTKAQVRGVLVKKKGVFGWAPTGMGRYTKWRKAKKEQEMVLAL